MEFAHITRRYLARFKAAHGSSTTGDQWSALNAILGCRTEQYDQLRLSCQNCPWQSSRFRSCGHRACNQCQNHNTTQWLERQTAKLLPVEYFMVTFTLPAELRGLAKTHQQVMYSLLFDCAISTLKSFGLNDKELTAELAATAVLHTHTRRLDYHPHIHLIVPGGGVNTRRNEWRKRKDKYLFSGFKLAAVFRGRMLEAIALGGLAVPTWHSSTQRATRRSGTIVTSGGHSLSALGYLTCSHPIN